jgi:hypothetical protein
LCVPFEFKSDVSADGEELVPKAPKRFIGPRGIKFAPVILIFGGLVGLCCCLGGGLAGDLGLGCLTFNKGGGGGTIAGC